MMDLKHFHGKLKVILVRGFYKKHGLQRRFQGMLFVILMTIYDAE